MAPIKLARGDGGPARRLFALLPDGTDLGITKRRRNHRPSHSNTQITGISVLRGKAPLMRYEDDSRPDCDTTLQALATVIDGSLSGLAHYHLLRQELDNIRALPSAASVSICPAAPSDLR